MVELLHDIHVLTRLALQRYSGWAVLIQRHWFPDKTKAKLMDQTEPHKANPSKSNILACKPAWQNRGNTAPALPGSGLHFPSPPNVHELQMKPSPDEMWGSFEAATTTTKTSGPTCFFSANLDGVSSQGWPTCFKNGQVNKLKLQPPRRTAASSHEELSVPSCPARFLLQWGWELMSYLSTFNLKFRCNYSWIAFTTFQCGDIHNIRCCHYKAYCRLFPPCLVDIKNK